VRSFGDFASRVNAVQERHDEINHGYIRLKLLSQADRFAALGGFPDHIKSMPLK
jgi:hypothetical protein